MRYRLSFNSDSSACLCEQTTPVLRLEFKQPPSSSGGVDAAALQVSCPLEKQDLDLPLPANGSAGRLQRDTSTTLAGGLQRRNPNLKLGLGPPVTSEALPIVHAGTPSWL
jgi:hypothetical protein